MWNHFFGHRVCVIYIYNHVVPWLVVMLEMASKSSLLGQIALQRSWIFSLWNLKTEQKNGVRTQQKIESVTRSKSTYWRWCYSYTKWMYFLVPLSKWEIESWRRKQFLKEFLPQVELESKNRLVRLSCQKEKNWRWLEAWIQQEPEKCLPAS